MTNKEFQEILHIYPDDFQICMDNVFGWESCHNMIDPHLYINTDIGQIEIEPDEYRDLWHYVKDGDYPEDGMLILASYVSEFTKKRIYEATYYPEQPLTDKMDKWFRIPTEEDL